MDTQILIEDLNGVPTINGIVCTYQTKEIRKTIQDMFKENQSFVLPEEFTYEIKPSGFWGQVAKIIIKKPIHIKLLSFWKLDDKYQYSRKLQNGCIEHGIWEVIGVEIKDSGRVYNFRCVMPMHEDLPLNTERKMHEEMILTMCHEVKNCSST